MGEPGIYLKDVIIEYKDGTKTRIPVDPNSKIVPSYNISIVAEGIKFQLRVLDEDSNNRTLVRDWAELIMSDREEISNVGYNIYNNNEVTETLIRFNLNSDVSYVRNLLYQETYIYTNRSDI